MKNFALGAFLVMASFTQSFANFKAPVQPSFSEELKIITITELTPSGIQSFFQGEATHVILECPEGVALPFKVNVESEFLNLIPHSFDLPRAQIKKTCFIMCQKGEFFFSTDLEEWKSFREFFTGKMGVSLNMIESLPVISLDITLNQKN